MIAHKAFLTLLKPKPKKTSLRGLRHRQKISKPLKAKTAQRHKDLEADVAGKIFLKPLKDLKNLQKPEKPLQNLQKASEKPPKSLQKASKKPSKSLQKDSKKPPKSL